MSPGLRTPSCDQQLLGVLERRVAVVEVRHQQRRDVAVHRHPALALDLRGEAEDRHVDLLPAHPERGRARLGEREDRLAAEVVGGEERRHRDRLVDPAEGLVGEAGVERDLLGALGLDADRRHHLDRLDRVAAGRGLGREHHRVGAVEHGVGDVAHLGARRHRVDDHRLHHLRRGDGDAVHLARHLDHPLLQRRHRRVADLDREVAARDHDPVGRLQDRLERRDRLAALDLGDQLRLVPPLLAGDVGELARHLHVGRALRKAHRQVLALERHRGLDVLHVLGGQGRRGQAAAGLVDALVVRELAADDDASCAPPRRCTESTIRRSSPSLRSSVSPGRTSRGSSL